MTFAPYVFGRTPLVKSEDEYFAVSANHISLVQARKNFAKFGTCEFDMIKYVRQPNKDELNGID